MEDIGKREYVANFSSRFFGLFKFFDGFIKPLSEQEIEDNPMYTPEMLRANKVIHGDTHSPAITAGLTHNLVRGVHIRWSANPRDVFHFGNR